MKTKIIVLISICPEVLPIQAGLLVRYLTRKNHRVEQKTFSSRIPIEQYIDENLFQMTSKQHSNNDNWVIIQDLSCINGFQISPELSMLADLVVLLDIHKIGDESFNKTRESLLVKANKYHRSIAICSGGSTLNQELIDLVDHI